MTREIQTDVMRTREIATKCAKRAGIPEDRGIITAQVIAQRIFPEEGVDYLTHPLAKRVNFLVDLATYGRHVLREQGRRATSPS